MEHRTPKARYRRTSKKFFIEQMARIERRQQRLRRLRAKYHKSLDLQHPAPTVSERVTLDIHHHIGKSQSEYESIGPWLSQHTGDPAIKVIKKVSQAL